MKNYETNIEIQLPAQAWLTASVIMDLDKTLETNPEISIKEYIEQQKRKTNLWKDNSDMPVYNLGALFMMAYSFLLIPKEAIEQNKLSISYEEIEVILSKMNIQINENEKGLDKNVNKIRHIRNSIAHMNIKIIPERESIKIIDECWDKKSHKLKETFEGEITINDFKALIDKYLKAFYKSYHETFIKKV